MLYYINPNLQYAIDRLYRKVRKAAIWTAIIFIITLTLFITLLFTTPIKHTIVQLDNQLEKELKVNIE